MGFLGSFIIKGVSRKNFNTMFPGVNTPKKGCRGFDRLLRLNMSFRSEG